MRVSRTCWAAGRRPSTRLRRARRALRPDRPLANGGRRKGSDGTGHSAFSFRAKRENKYGTSAQACQEIVLLSGLEVTHFRRDRRDGGRRGVAQGERRRRGKIASGLRGGGQAQTRVEAVIAVEHGDEFHVWRERPDVALRKLEVGIGKRPRQARDMQGGEALGRVERPFGERLVDFAPDRGEADPERGRDLPVGIAGGDEVETGLPALDALRPARLRRGPSLGAERGMRVRRSCSVSGAAILLTEGTLAQTPLVSKKMSLFCSETVSSIMGRRLWDYPLRLRGTACPSPLPEVRGLAVSPLPDRQSLLAD